MARGALPIVLAIPHASEQIPRDLLERMLAVTPDEAELRERLHRNTDVFTDALYAWDVPVLHRVVARYSRFVADANRSRSGAEEVSNGGAGPIRLTDFDGIPLVDPDDPPTEADRERWLQLAWDPFHEELRCALADPRVRLVLDCHSMAVRYYSGPRAGQVRPALCVSNRGANGTGEPHPKRGPLSADAAVTREVARVAGELFTHLMEEGGPTGVGINLPFAGGYILKSSPLPAISLEVNQGLYVGEDWQLIPGRITAIQDTLAELATRIVELV